MRGGLIVCAIAVLCMQGADARTVFQCRDASGAVTMQDRACDGASAQSEREIEEAYQSTSRISNKRSAKAKAAFQRMNPCPRNGAARGRCPGYDIDHVKALCAGGPDVPGNMQWLTLEEHREKTRKDVFECRLQRKAREK